MELAEDSSLEIQVQIFMGDMGRRISEFGMSPLGIWYEYDAILQESSLTACLVVAAFAGDSALCPAHLLLLGLVLALRRTAAAFTLKQVPREPNTPQFRNIA